MLGLCLFCDYCNCSSSPRANHNFPDFSLTDVKFPDFSGFIRCVATTPKAPGQCVISGIQTRPVERRSRARENILAGPYHNRILWGPKSRHRRRRDRGREGNMGVMSPHYPTRGLGSGRISFPTWVLSEPWPKMDFTDIWRQKEAIWKTLFGIFERRLWGPQTSRGPGKLSPLPSISTGGGKGQSSVLIQTVMTQNDRSISLPCIAFHVSYYNLWLYNLTTAWCICIVVHFCQRELLESTGFLPICQNQIQGPYKGYIRRTKSHQTGTFISIFYAHFRSERSHLEHLFQYQLVRSRHFRKSNSSTARTFIHRFKDFQGACPFSMSFQALKIWRKNSRTFKDPQEPWK